MLLVRLIFVHIKPDCHELTTRFWMARMIKPVAWPPPTSIKQFLVGLDRHHFCLHTIRYGSFITTILPSTISTAGISFTIVVDQRTRPKVFHTSKTDWQTYEWLFLTFSWYNVVLSLQLRVTSALYQLFHLICFHGIAYLCRPIQNCRRGVLFGGYNIIDAIWDKSASKP